MYHDTIIDGTDGIETLKTLTDAPVGYSVARTAKILGMTRSAVSNAISRDALHATRIYIITKDGKKLISTEVDRESVHTYLNVRNGRQRAPAGYIDDQLSLLSNAN